MSLFKYVYVISYVYIEERKIIRTMASLINVAEMAAIEKKRVRVTPSNVSLISSKNMYLERRHVYLWYQKLAYLPANLELVITILGIEAISQLYI